MGSFSVDTALLSQLVTQLHNAWLDLSENQPSSLSAVSDGETGLNRLTDALHQYSGVAQTAHTAATDHLSTVLQLVNDARQAYDTTEGGVVSGANKQT